MMQKELTPLAQYIEEMRLRRDPPPSWNLMATDAGLSPSQVAQIVKGQIKKPTSDTLRKIVRRWGTPEDERELLRLAGHPAPMEPGGVTETERLMLEVHYSMTPEQQQAHLGLLQSGLTPAEMVGRLFAGIEITTADQDAWLAGYPEPRTVDGLTLSLMNEDERFMVKCYRVMNPRGQAMNAVALRKFYDAHLRGRSVGPVLTRQWVLLLDRIDRMPEADQRRLLAFIEKQASGSDLSDPATGKVLLTVFERRALNMFTQLPAETMTQFTTALANDPQPGQLTRLILTDLDPTPEELDQAQRILVDVNGQPIPEFLLSDFDRMLLRRMRLFSPARRLESAVFQVRYSIAEDSAAEFVRRFETVLEADPGLLAPVEHVTSEPEAENGAWADMHEIFGNLSPEVQRNLVTMARAVMESNQAPEDENADDVPNTGGIPGAVPA